MVANIAADKKMKQSAAHGPLAATSRQPVSTSTSIPVSRCQQSNVANSIERIDSFTVQQATGLESTNVTTASSMVPVSTSTDDLELTLLASANETATIATNADRNSRDNHRQIHMPPSYAETTRNNGLPEPPPTYQSAIAETSKMA